MRVIAVNDEPALADRIPILDVAFTPTIFADFWVVIVILPTFDSEFTPNIFANSCFAKTPTPELLDTPIGFPLGAAGAIGYETIISPKFGMNGGRNGGPSGCVMASAVFKPDRKISRTTMAVLRLPGPSCRLSRNRPLTRTGVALKAVCVVKYDGG